nr:M48 family metallopeptidase [uncultured Rhodoferax sp.]
MTDASPVTNYSVLMTAAFALALVASVMLKFWLATRQMRHVARHRDAVPAAFQAQISLEAHHKAADYTIAQGRLGLLELAFSTAMVLGWTLLGGLNTLNQTLLSWFNTSLDSALPQQLALLGAFGLIGAIIDLPFSLYRTFVLEQRFGFNRMTARLWIGDALKGLMFSVVIGLPLAALALWVMAATGELWWLWTWALWISFNLLMLLVYPTWIAPLFNQFKPLDDAALKDRVSALMARCGFTSKGFYVMDGSKRSAHANAYFTGFGASKRVVFYDTLLAQLSPAEVDAVLAHELGHFKHKHIVKRMVSLFGLSLLGFALLGWVSQQVWFYTGLGVVPSMTGANDALALLLFMMVLPLLGSFVGPVFAQLSRKHEFEADAYAVAHTSGADLSSALLKLYKDNASTLTPDPVYVKFYYSHPPASERLGRMLAPAAGT